MKRRNTWALSLSIKTPTEETFAALEQAGISCIELSLCLIERVEQHDFVNRSREIVTLAASHGIRVGSFHLPFDMHIECADQAETEKILTWQKSWIAACGKAGIPIAVIHPGYEPNPEEEREARMEKIIAFLQELTEYAASCHVKLAVENLPRTCLGRDSKDMLQMLHAIPGLYACFDANHSLKEDNVHFIRALGNRIIALHISDYDMENERHWLPGAGINDWEGILCALEEIGYSGVFNYELKAGLFEGYEEMVKVRENYEGLMK